MNFGSGNVGHVESNNTVVARGHFENALQVHLFRIVSVIFNVVLH